MVARPGEAITGSGHTKALTSSLIRPALGSYPRFRARLPDRAGNPQRAGGAHGSLVQYAIPRAGGEARHAKGDERREGESSVFRRIKIIFSSTRPWPSRPWLMNSIDGQEPINDQLI
jgi:hypothetical protein